MRRRRWLGVVVAAAVLALALLLRGHHGGDRARVVARAPEAPPVTETPRDRPRGGERRLRSSAEAPAATAPSRAPVIDDVRLEKQEVCEGEENLVTVVAHTPDNADDAFLHFMVGSRTGNPVVVRASAASDGVGAAKVIAFGRNGVATAVDMPRFVVKPCKAPYVLSLSLRMLPNHISAFELTARVVPLGATAPFEPQRFLWSFGDGTTEETAAPVVSHDFSRRPQRTMASTFLIGCAALSRTGQRVEGRQALELHNLAFESFAYKGVVKILVEPDPLFPVLGSDGVVTQRFRIWHAYDAPVRIDGLRRLKLTEGVAEPAAERVSARALGVSSVAPGEAALSRPLALDTNAEPGVYSVEYVIEGTTEDGWPATGNFALMRPPALPTRERSATVGDAALKARILRARELLGQAYVTDEDLWRLQREGAFDGLAVDAPSAPATPDSPPPRPPAPRRGP